MADPQMTKCAKCEKPITPSPEFVWGATYTYMCCSKECHNAIRCRMMAKGWVPGHTDTHNYLKVTWMRYTRDCLAKSETIAMWNALPEGENLLSWCPWARCDVCHKWMLHPVANPVYELPPLLVCSDRCYTMREARFLLDGYSVSEERVVGSPSTGRRLLTAFCKSSTYMSRQANYGTRMTHYHEVWRYR